MSVNPLGSGTSTSSLNSLLLQQLLAESSSSQDSSTQDSSGLSGILGDLVSLSSAGQQLNSAPASVTQALSDLLSGQKDAQGDLSELKSYFKQNPQNLASVLASLQGNSSTYSATGLLASGSDSKTLMAAMLQFRGQDPLLASLGSSDSSSSSDLSFLG